MASSGLTVSGRVVDVNSVMIKLRRFAQERQSPALRGFEYGAGTKSRTRDLLITSQLLYQLSYTG